MEILSKRDIIYQTLIGESNYSEKSIFRMFEKIKNFQEIFIWRYR